MNADYFLLSSFDAIPDHYLQGFCFQDEDLILGDGGYDKYRISKGSDIQSGQDGAYVVVQKSDTGTRIGADSSGYFKLFLYKHKNHWAVSNSLVELAKFASSKNLPVSVDESHLSSFFIKGSFGNQLASLRTSVSEIQLVPASMEVFVFRSIFGPKVTLRPTPTISGFERRYQDYPDAIGEFLRLWIGRMATIMKSDLLAVSELTGGRDSRTNLSLMLAAAERFGTDLMQNVRITSSPAAEKDFAIAGQIASRFKLRFMDSSSDPRFARRMTTPQAYQKWKALCLGVYTPIYFPSARHTPTMVKFGGAGGESHRRFYPEMTPSKFIDNRKNFIPSSRHFKKLKQDILQDLESLRQGFEASTDPMVVHYRHFRDRCHGGRSPQYMNMISPLSSLVLKRASSMCSQDHINRSQVLADILLNANSDLAFMPYDDPGKSLDARHISEKVDAVSALRAVRGDGVVFAEDSAPQEDGGFSTTDGSKLLKEDLLVHDADFSVRGTLKLLKEDFLVHYEQVRRNGFFPTDYIESAKRTVEDAALNGSLSHPVHGAPVSHVILAGELSRVSK